MTSFSLTETGGRSFPFTRATALVFLLAAGRVFAAFDFAPPVSRPPDDQVLVTLDSHAPDEPKAVDGEVAGRVHALIDQSRRQGSLRPLGRAQSLLDGLGKDVWREEHVVLAAVIAQRQHRFDRARELLLAVLESNPDHRQAVLTLYSVALVQADYALGDNLCSRMAGWGHPLLAASCRQNLRALRGEGAGAFEALSSEVASYRGERSDWVYRWALTTLAEIARSIDHPQTGKLWSKAYLADPGNPYVATEFADWLIARGDYRRAHLLLSRVPHSDRADVLRLIALEALDAPQAESLRRELDARFREAGARDHNFHRREYARYLLDVRRDPQAALEMARDNWRIQKARADRRLLLRARQAASSPVTQAEGAS